MLHTPNIDNCVRMLQEAKEVIETPFNRDFLFETIERQRVVKAMFKYRLFSPITVDIESKEKEEARLKYPQISDFQDFWFVMKKYELVTAQDIKTDFLKITTSLENINKYFDFANGIFDDVNFVYYTDMETIKNNFGDVRGIDEEQANEIYTNIQTISIQYNRAWGVVKDVFSEIRKITGKYNTNKDDANESYLLQDWINTEKISYADVLDCLRTHQFISESNVWIDTKKGYKQAAVTIIKNLRKKGCLNANPKTRQIKEILRTTFSIKVDDKTIRIANETLSPDLFPQFP